MRLFPDHHLPPATLLLVLTSLLFFLSLLLCLPLPAVPAHAVLFLGPGVWEKAGETTVLIFQGVRCLGVEIPACPQASRKAPQFNNSLSHKPWAHRGHVKPTQVQVGLRAFQICFSVVNLHIHLHIWFGKSPTTRSALLRLTSLPL